MKEGFDRVNRRIDDVAAKSEKDLEEERKRRASADQNIIEQLRRAVAGQIHLNLLGVLWFVLGTIAGGASSELSWLFVPLAC